jgi:hypothetical protein
VNKDAGSKGTKHLKRRAEQQKIRNLLSQPFLLFTSIPKKIQEDSGKIQER